jgi:hypothetical protein
MPSESVLGEYLLFLPSGAEKARKTGILGHFRGLFGEFSGITGD